MDKRTESRLTMQLQINTNKYEDFGEIIRLLVTNLEKKSDFGFFPKLPKILLYFVIRKKTIL